MHEDETCQAYLDRSRNAAEQMSAAAIRATMKKCPNCAVSIEKSDGCNHMTSRISFAGRVLLRIKGIQLTTSVVFTTHRFRMIGFW
ncbi:hypothetical protein D0865_07937 [Hortaea werneckii]|uniref:Uncharacterized protein n=1 Tax=Hortaea werneckii TaxID=91943 RepID=A0A3M7C9E4_HORWE|nr:hypothetical protein D0865_07937 [Hortaea werneckii]